MGYVLSRVSAVTMCHHIWSCATTYGLRVVTYGSCVVTLGYVLSHMGFQSPLQRPKGYYLGRRTACLGTSAHRPCFDLSVCLQPVCLSPDSQSDCLRFFSLPQSRSIFHSHLPIGPFPSLYLSHTISLPTHHQDGLRFVLPCPPRLPEPSSPQIHPRYRKKRGVNSRRQSFQAGTNHWAGTILPKARRVSR